MKDKEIKEIIKIMGTADGGCYCCASSLIEQFVGEFDIDTKLASKIIKEVAFEEDWYWKDDLKERFDWYVEVKNSN